MHLKLLKSLLPSEQLLHPLLLYHDNCTALINNLNAKGQQTQRRGNLTSASDQPAGIKVIKDGPGILISGNSAVVHVTTPLKFLYKEEKLVSFEILVKPITVAAAVKEKCTNTPDTSSARSLIM